MIVHLNVRPLLCILLRDGLCVLQVHPAFLGKPLAVCHSNHAGGSAEISSCNYEARDLGIKGGMCMSTAKNLCPHLLVLPYEVCLPLLSLQDTFLAALHSWHLCVLAHHIGHSFCHVSQ